MQEKPKYIVIKESFLQSVFADICMYGIIVGGGYINHRFIGDNGFVYTILLVCMIILIMSYATGRSNRYYDKQKLIKDLQDDKI